MVTLGVILILLGTSVYAVMSRSLMDQVDRNLVSRHADALAASMGGGPGHPGPDAAGYRGGFFLVQLASDGTVLANPQQVPVAGITWPTQQSRGSLLETITLNNEPTRIFVEHGPDGTTLIIGQSLQPVQSAMRSLLIVLIGGGGVGLLLSLAAAWFLSGRALVPIQDAFRRQQEFVADASHELRTPLTVLRSATDLLSTYRDHRLADHADLLDDVRAEILRMEGLANDLLILARSDRGELQLMTAPVDLAILASDVVRRIRPLAELRSHLVAFEGPDAHPSVEVDPERVQQVLLILLDNAMKYTPEGGRIEVRVHADASNAVVEVSDTGQGIAPEHLPRLFDRFYRADAARSRAAGGAGLGLSIAKLLVDAHDGELSVTSTPGEGTHVSVRLPLADHTVSLGHRLGDLATHLPV
jgi:two-component system, OmpR family, sensor histidine kinase CiaH